MIRSGLISGSLCDINHNIFKKLKSFYLNISAESEIKKLSYLHYILRSSQLGQTTFINLLTFN